MLYFDQLCLHLSTSLILKQTLLVKLICVPMKYRININEMKHGDLRN